MKFKTFILTFLMMMSSPFLFGHQTGAKYDWDNVASLQDNAKMDTQFQIGDNSRGSSEAVAQIGSNTYETLQDAFQEVQDGQTVILLTDAEINTETYTIADGKSVTFDMNGKKLTVTDNKNGNNTAANYELFYIYGEMTVKGEGTIELTANYNRAWYAMSAIFHNRGGILTIENGTFKHLGGTDMAWVVDNSGNYYGDATTNIKDGELTSSYTAIRNRMEQNTHGASGTAYLNVYGGEINGTTSAIWAQAASTSTTAPATGEINIIGGNIGAINTARSNGAKCMTTISGGTVASFKGEVGELRVVAPGEITGEITILTPGGEPADYIIDENGNYIEPTIINVDSQDALQSAINNSQSGDVITVNEDIELTSSITIPTGKYVILDLNGKTISMQDASGAGAYAIKNNGNLTIKDSAENNGNLTIKDSAEGGKITFNSTTPDNNAVPGYSTSTIGNGGHLTIENGIIENTTVDGASYAIDGIWHTGEVSLTINDGTITAKKIAVRQVPFSATAKNTVTINGGTLTGEMAGLQMFNTSNNAMLSETVINGGVFNGTYGFYTSFTSAQGSNLATINIDGGVFNGYVFLYNRNNGSNAYPMTVAITDGIFNAGAYVYTKDNNGNEVPIKSISGGTFASDPSEYCAEGYICEYDEETGTYGVVEDPNVAQIGETKYTSLQAAENAAKDGETIVLLEDIVLDGMVTFFNSANPRMLTLDMNNKTITMSDDWDNTTAKSAFWVCDGLTITGNGTINAAPANEAAVYAIIVGHRTAGTTDGNAGTLVIENGTFYGNDASVISVTNGIATINGGTFESPGEFDLNCIDDMYSAGKANITVKGGTFVGFNPENNAVEGAGTNFCADGYAALPDLNGNFIVGVRPTATVNNLGRMTIPGGEYAIYNGNSLQQTTELDPAMPLSFVMQFLADQDVNEMATSPFAEWYGDFVITFTGIEGDSFEPAGCYLAGHYGYFGWVKIPVDEMTIEEGVRYPVMLGAGLGQQYQYICSSVEDFKCALYLTPEILAENPNIQVNLELAIVDNSQGDEAAANALENNTNVYEVVDYDYDAIDFNMNYVARIGDKGYETLAEAVAAANNEETVELLISAQGSGVVIDKDITIDFGGFTYTFTSPAVGSEGTETQGFQILKDNTVVLKNGTLNVEASAGEAFAMLIQNYADLTITDMTLDGDHLDRNNYSYVLSVNCGNVLINGSTSILANEVEGENHFAFDSYDYSAGGYTELPVVTVNTTGAIKGAVEVSATLNITNLGKDSEISYISIDGKGQLFHNGLTTTIKKHIEGHPVPENNNEYVGGWYTISSPVGTVDHEKVDGLLNGTHDLYYYNEVEMMWENVKDTEDNTYTKLENGQGYLYANSVDTDLLFNGPLNTAAVTYSISYTEGNSLAGFNLIGNPFTYDIALENITGAELASGFYTLTKEGAWGASISSIGACQGALVKTTSASKITINPAVAPKRTASENNGALAITVSNANYSDVAYVSFNKGIGLDKIEHRNANIPMVYVPVNGTNYAVAIMSQDVTEIPVSFVAKTMGEYTISVEAQDCEFAQMYLIDKMTGYSTNLLLEDYTFIATSKDNADRFIIRLVNSFDHSFGAENFVIFSNDEMMINDIQGEGVIRIVDVLGRPVAEYNVFGSANISTTSFRSGAYMIQVIDESGVKVQKIIID